MRATQAPAAATVSVSSSSPLPAVRPEAEPIQGVKETVIYFLCWSFGMPWGIFLSLIGWPEEIRERRSQ